MNESPNSDDGRQLVSAVFALTLGVLGAYVGAQVLTTITFLPRWFTFWTGLIVGFALTTTALYLGFQKVLQWIDRTKVRAAKKDE